jgi:hypothetical protein
MMTAVTPIELPPWRNRLNECLPLFGHRNWIVVADAAYPAQSGEGIETIVTGSGHIEAVRGVCEAIAAAPHVRAHIFMDAEMAFVAEHVAPGISRYRNQLDAIFAGLDRSEVGHEQIIGRLAASAQMFRILILKTRMTIPYTSVFFELGCGYWSAEAEARLRGAMEGAKGGGR